MRFRQVPTLRRSKWMCRNQCITVLPRWETIRCFISECRHPWLRKAIEVFMENCFQRKAHFMVLDINVVPWDALPTEVLAQTILVHVHECVDAISACFF